MFYFSYPHADSESVDDILPGGAEKAKVALAHKDNWKLVLLSYARDEQSFVGGQAIGSKEMKLDYDFIEDSFDDTTNIRSMTEQARIPGGWLVRTTVYSPHHISVAVTFVPVEGKKKKLFEPIA